MIFKFFQLIFELRPGPVRRRGDFQCLSMFFNDFQRCSMMIISANQCCSHSGAPGVVRPGVPRVSFSTWAVFSRTVTGIQETWSGVVARPH